MQRSRAALMAAAVRLVSERGTTAIPVTDLAEAADVSRQLVYLQFGDRDSLLVAAAVDLVERELLPLIGDVAEAGRTMIESGRSAAQSLAEMGRERVLATARHFARHRSFYRAMLTGSCAFAMTRALGSVFGLLQEQAVRVLFGELDGAATADLAAFLSGGTGALINEWLISDDDPLDPEELADRLLRLMSLLASGCLAPPSRQSE